MQLRACKSEKLISNSIKLHSSAYRCVIDETNGTNLVMCVRVCSNETKIYKMREKTPNYNAPWYVSVCVCECACVK